MNLQLLVTIICKKWEEFIDKYQKHFMSNEEQWNIKLELVAQYIEQNDNRPSHHDKSNEIKQMGNWICDQIKNIMSDPNTHTHNHIGLRIYQYTLNYE